MFTVTVLTPRGRRQQVKVTPNTTLLQVLEEVCTKYGLNAMEYDLRHHNKVLDVSSMFRFTSLPNNAQLEMTEAVKQRQESPVTLGVQLESGERLTGVFIPSDSVWHVIVTLKPDEENMNHVVAIYMRQEIYGKENLSKTTLRSLGLTGGRAILRLLHKSPEELRTQANVTTNLTRPSVPEVTQRDPSKSPEPRKRDVPVKKVDESPPATQSPPEVPKVSPPPPDSGPPEPQQQPQQQPPRVSTAENFNFKGNNVFEKLLKDEKTKKSLMAERGTTKKSSNSTDVSTRSTEKSKGKSVKQEAKKTAERTDKSLDREWIKREMEKKREEGKVIVLGDRSAVAYNLNSIQPATFEDEPDDFYDLTISDAKMLLSDAKKLCAELEDAPLMTAAQRELEKDKKVLALLHQYRKTVIRVKFPDRTVLQGTFSPVDTVGDVEKFVADYLENPKTKFYLYTTPPKVVLKSQERLIECGCVPSSVLYFGQSADASAPSQYLKSDVLEKLSTPSAAALTAFESRGTERKLRENEFDDSDKRKLGKSQTGPQPGPSRDQSKFPKWFKANK